MADILPDAAWALALGTLSRMGNVRLKAALDGRTAHDAVRTLRAGGSFPNLPAPPELLALWRRELASVDAEKLWQRSLDAGIHVAVIGDHDYPSDLAADIAPPAVLTWSGDLGVLAGPRVAIVGTRNATATGLDVAFELGQALADNGIRVVSGLADGIDAAAHRGALDAGNSGAPPIGVVGSGLDVIYPRRSASIWRKVAEHGVLLSEAPPGCSPTAWRFPQRNRIIAALAEIIIVVESRSAGGSMITVTEAIHRGRTVMAVPGSVRSAASSGTNDLLYDGVTPVRSPRDVLFELGMLTEEARDQKKAKKPKDPDDARVLRLFGSDAHTLDDIVNVAGQPIAEVAMRLNRLEDEGFLDRRGGWYVPQPKR